MVGCSGPLDSMFFFLKSSAPQPWASHGKAFSPRVYGVRVVQSGCEQRSSLFPFRVPLRLQLCAKFWDISELDYCKHIFAFLTRKSLATSRPALLAGR